jgi:4,5-dihydroxyphthalate decarboxylase
LRCENSRAIPAWPVHSKKEAKALSKRIPLVLACGDYEITRALREGAVKPDGIDLTVLTAMDSTTRHWRYLRGGEFDVGEVSCSSYYVSRDQGSEENYAIPVFLHRRFRHGFIFINTTKGIKSPKDLIGKKIGLKQYQATAIVWMRGILEHEYGVPHQSIDWYTELDETIDFQKPANLRLQKVPDDKTVEGMLAEGELDAVLHPDLIKPMMEKDPRVGRLFPDFKNEEISYFKKTGIFPIMHVMAIKKEVVERYPWVPINLYHAFEEAKTIAMKRMINPRIVPLAWYRESWEEQEEIIGSDPWEYGPSEQNIKTIDTLAGYLHEQGLTKKKWSFDELFLSIFQGRKRGVEFRL